MFHDSEFWIGVALVLMIGTLIYYGVPEKMGQALDGRSIRIRSEIDEAGRLHREALALVADYRTKKQEAMAEAQAIVAAARDEAERITAEARRDLETALARHQAQAAFKIEQMQARAGAVDELNGQLVINHFLTDLLMAIRMRSGTRMLAGDIEGERV